VTGLSTSFCYFFIFLTSFTFPILSDVKVLDLAGTFYLYSFLALLGLIFVRLAVPSDSEDATLNGLLHNRE
jgi:hypothetical protein